MEIKLSINGVLGVVLMLGMFFLFAYNITIMNNPEQRCLNAVDFSIDYWNNFDWKSLEPTDFIYHTRCYMPNQCYSDPTLKGCEFDGCNWCCDDICSLTACVKEVKYV